MSQSISCLIVRLGSLGDVVHAIPVAAALRERYPDARLDWVTDPAYVELLDLVTGLDHRIPLDTRALAGGPSGLLAGVGGLRRARYDVVVDLQGLVKSAVLARLSGAPRRIGFPRGDLREPLARLFYTETPELPAAAHVIEKNLALVAPLGVTGAAVRFPLALPPSAAAARVQDGAADGFVVINPGAAWPNKRWEPTRFGAVAAAIRDRYGWPSVVLWGPGEQPRAAAVVAASDGAASASPATTVPDLLSIARAARLFISGDTGPLHLAAAVGTPIVALFGPTRPERNGPWVARDVVVSRVDRCSCVYERRCRLANACINDITVPEVVAAVARRLERHG